MDIVDHMREAVLRQQEESVSNDFPRVEGMREFLKSNMPGAGVVFTVKMVCFAAERLTADNGTRVTLVDFLTHARSPSLCKDLSELNVVNQKPFVTQITVWDAKKRVSSPSALPILFRQESVY
ncbi:hypothetical protein PHMEG_00011253 [Phytophthora megakarya]|uniref:Uncharacterized protein n=1 Tax=Phytophthora megakarya TaxID=4795 RepID=A0A225WBP3_9STRA|nr:hypothetical protein PHMEG_00011253 [Phytophthora megakarya]